MAQDYMAQDHMAQDHMAKIIAQAKRQARSDSSPALCRAVANRRKTVAKQSQNSRKRSPVHGKRAQSLEQNAWSGMLFRAECLQQNAFNAWSRLLLMLGAECYLEQNAWSGMLGAECLEQNAWSGMLLMLGAECF